MVILRDRYPNQEDPRIRPFPDCRDGEFVANGETFDAKEARKRSVDNLQRLYTFVVGLAVTEMLRRMLNPLATDYAVWLMFTAFLFTVVPFYHGANRYLDATYVTGERR